MRFANLIKYLNLYVLPLYPITKFKRDDRYYITNPSQDVYRVESSEITMTLTSTFDKLSIVGTHSKENYPIHIYFDKSQEVPSVLPINGWATVYEIIVELLYDAINEGSAISKG